MVENSMTASEIIAKLGLEKHDEGGWFKETYRSSTKTGENNDRNVNTVIYYLLESSTPYNLLHMNKSDINHFYHAGGNIKYILLHPDGTLEEKILGPDGDYQVCVPSGVWKATQLIDSNWALLSESVSPGFDYADRTLATPEHLKNFPPETIQSLSLYLSLPKALRS